MKTLHHLGRTHLIARPDCAAYLPAFAGARSTAAAPPSLKRADTGGVETGISAMPALSAPETRLLVEAIDANQPCLNWWSAYTEADMAGRGFATGMAACLFCGPGGPFEAPDGRAGFFYVKEGVEYAAHRHQPDEIYAVLAGRARFWNEATGWGEAGPGDVIHTPSWSWHAMATDRGPVLIMWAWIGEGYDLHPEFRDETGALPG